MVCTASEAVIHMAHRPQSQQLAVCLMHVSWTGLRCNARFPQFIRFMTFLLVLLRIPTYFRPMHADFPFSE